MPRSNKFRPDFMATGPHAIVQKEKPLNFADDDDSPNDDDEEGFKYKYYESDKILGKLFRAIDEREILSHVQSNLFADVLCPTEGEPSILRAVWEHIQTVLERMKSQIPQWHLHLSTARGIRDEYVYVLAFPSFTFH